MKTALGLGMLLRPQHDLIFTNQDIMRIALGIIGMLVLLVLLSVGIGYSLPVKHRATRAISLQASPDSIYSVLVNASAFPEWRSKVKSVEVITRADGLTSYREKGGDGDILYVVDEVSPGQRLVTRIADDKLPFGGKWTFQLTPAAGGTQLRITEDGEVYNPLFRFMSRFVFGHHATIETYLEDVARKFGQTATISP